MPMTLDEFYSLKDGPIASAALNGINGELNSNIWKRWIALNGIKVSAVQERERTEYDHLSNADVQVLDAVWERFGALPTSKIWDFVHKLPEYTPVEKGRVPIRYKDILQALRKESADELAEDFHRLQKSLARFEA